MIVNGLKSKPLELLLPPAPLEPTPSLPYGVSVGTLEGTGASVAAPCETLLAPPRIFCTTLGSTWGICWASGVVVRIALDVFTTTPAAD